MDDGGVVVVGVVQCLHSNATFPMLEKWAKLGQEHVACNGRGNISASAAPFFLLRAPAKLRRCIIHDIPAMTPQQMRFSRVSTTISLARGDVRKNQLDRNSIRVESMRCDG
jgi:hypothetical protein